MLLTNNNMQMVKSYSSGKIFPFWEGIVLTAYSLPMLLPCIALAISPTLSLSLFEPLSMWLPS
jgi:hypothetical protein